MRITAALRGEHGVFYPQFEALAEMAETADRASDIRIAGGVLAAALTGHAQLENDLLFTALEARMGPGGPPAVMREDHARIEGALGRLSEESDLARARQLLVDCIAEARVHFGREEAVLFPLAERAVPDEELHRLGREWAAARGVELVEEG